MTRMINIFRHSFFKSSSIVLVGFAVVSVLNYTFTLVMGRMLISEQFGEVSTLLALSVIIGVPSATLIKIMAKYTAGFKARSQTSMISSLFKFFARYSLAFGAAILLLFWILIPWLGSFFKIESLPLFIFSLILPISLLSALNTGTLQGLQKFVPFSLIGVIGTVLKLVLSVILVYLGFSVPGVMLALVISGLASYFYGLVKVKPSLKAGRSVPSESARKEIQWKDIVSYGQIIFWTTLLLALFLNVDVILAKHYLSSYLAGQYAALAVTGKIIFYGSGIFVTVMFPMVVASHASQDGKEKGLLKISLGIMVAISVLVLIFFTIFPEFAIRMLFGVKYLEVAPYLGWFGLAMVFYSLASVFVNYFMAVHARKFIYPFAAAIILQIILIILFHHDILAITMSVLAASTLMLVSMAGVYLAGGRKNKN